MDESERDQLIERIERLERSVKRGEDGLEVYASGFAKLRVELDAVRALVVSEEPQAAATAGACADTGSRCAARAAADAGRRSAAADTSAAGADFAAAASETARSASSHCRSARPGLGSRRRQGLRDRGWRVMALGVGFFFVLAANRGWVGEGMRIALGATASALVFTAGLVLRHATGSTGRARRGRCRHRRRVRDACSRGCPLRSRTGRARTSARRLDCGCGHNGRDSLALAGHRRHRPAWRGTRSRASALDTHLTWESVTFATIVLIATAIATVPRSWHPLLVTISVVVGLQVEWLAAESVSPPGPGTLFVAALFVFALLAIGIGDSSSPGKPSSTLSR